MKPHFHRDTLADTDGETYATWADAARANLDAAGRLALGVIRSCGCDEGSRVLVDRAAQEETALAVKGG